MDDSDHSKSRTLQVFHPFPRLPPELRNKIWVEASKLVLPRVVDICDEKEEGSFYTHAPCPALLHVCQASRDIMLKNWPLSFRTDSWDESTIPFNYELDTLYFNNDDCIEDKSFLDWVDLEERERIVRVAAPMMDDAEYYSGEEDPPEDETAELLQDLFPNLETLFLTRLTPDSYCYWIRSDGIENTPYDEYWELDKHETMLPHYLYLRKHLPEIDDQILYTDMFNALEMPYEEHPEWKRPHIEVSAPVIKIIGVEVDSWGYLIEKDDFDLQREPIEKNPYGYPFQCYLFEYRFQSEWDDEFDKDELLEQSFAERTIAVKRLHAIRNKKRLNQDNRIE